MTRPTIPRAGVLTAAVAIVVTGCVPEPATQQGREVADLYNFFMLASVVVFGIVVGLLAWSIVRYRGQPGRNVEMPPQTRGNMALEIAWWSFPALLIVVLAVLTIGVLSRVDARSEDPLTVEVQGFQWGWQFTYPDSGVVITGTAADPPSIRLPTGRTVAFIITSSDVVHSFNIPNFLIKRDAVPNRTNRFDVLIERVGTYGGQCGEFCGLLHARQLFEIDAVEPAAFEAWLDHQAAEAADR